MTLRLFYPSLSLAVEWHDFPVCRPPTWRIPSWLLNLLLASQFVHLVHVALLRWNFSCCASDLMFVLLKAPFKRNHREECFTIGQQLLHCCHWIQFVIADLLVCGGLFWLWFWIQLMCNSRLLWQQDEGWLRNHVASGAKKQPHATRWQTID